MHHLEDQLQIAGLIEADRLIGLRLIEETDEAGFMRGDVGEIAAALGTEVEDVEAVLGVCQGFEPTGETLAFLLDGSVRRAGDVIPEVVRVIAERRPVDGKGRPLHPPYELPTACPVNAQKIIGTAMIVRIRRKNCNSVSRPTLAPASSPSCTDSINPPGTAPKKAVSRDNPPRR